MKKNMPRFQSPEEAALFWENHEVLDYVDADEFKVVDPQKHRRYSFAPSKKKSKKQLISLRIESRLLERAKRLAARYQRGYQSILRSWLERGAPQR